MNLFLLVELASHYSADIDMLKLLQHHSITTIVTGQADSPLTHNNVPETLFAQVIALLLLSFPSGREH